MGGRQKAERLARAARLIRAALSEIEDVSDASHGVTVSMIDTEALAYQARRCDQLADAHARTEDAETEEERP